MNQTLGCDPKVLLLFNQDVSALNAAKAKRWNLNKPLADSEWTRELPITIALEHNKRKSLQWLLDHGAELNDKHSPAIVTACQHCDDFAVIDLLLAHGADLHARDAAGKTALQAALYGEHWTHIPQLIARGFELNSDGSVLRQAVSDEQEDAVDFLLENGIDVNFCQPDSVFPHNPTALHVAAQNGDLNQVKKLLKYGADVCLQDQLGERPYTAAVANGQHDLAALLRALEPSVWHSEAAALKRLAPYQIPPQLLAITRSEDRRMALPGNQRVRYIEFHALTDLRPIQHKRKTLINLLNQVDNYWALGFLVWDPQSKSLGSLDVEHKTYKKLGKAEQFLQDPSTFVDKIFA